MGKIITAIYAIDEGSLHFAYKRDAFGYTIVHVIDEHTAGVGYGATVDDALADLRASLCEHLAAL